MVEDLPEGLRERKKRATRLRISNVATELFHARGFDHVTIDEVAAAADVSKMTVFNYFARKEDLLFDRTGDLQQLLRDGLATRAGRPPIAALQAFAHALVARRHPLVRMTARVSGFWKVVADSPALVAHAHELAAGIERDLAELLAAAVGAPTAPLDPIAELVATVIVGGWRVAFRTALRDHRTATAEMTRGRFILLVDRGFDAATAAARGTPYATRR